MSVSDSPFISSTVFINISDETYYNGYDPLERYDSMRRATYTSIQIIISLEAALIIATNLFLLVVILSKSSLQRSLRNQLLISIAVANLTEGIFTGPLLVDVFTRQEWTHGCHVAVVHAVFSRYTHNYIIVWGMVLLVVNYLCRLNLYGGPAFFLRMSSRTKKYVGHLLLVLLPWIIAIPLTFSIVWSGVPDWVKGFWQNSLCHLFVERWAEITLSVFVVIPAVLLIVFVVLTIIVYKRRSVIGGPADQNTTLEGPSVHVAAVVVCIIMSVAEGLETYTDQILLSFPFKLVIFATVVCVSNMMSFVLPLLWLLLLKDLRANACEILARISVRFCKKRTSGASASVTFSNLSEEV